jgi:hypothetical protein
VTRGKKLAVLVDEKKAIAIAVNVSGRRRWSKPSEWLTEAKRPHSPRSQTMETPGRRPIRMEQCETAHRIKTRVRGHGRYQLSRRREVDLVENDSDCGACDSDVHTATLRSTGSPVLAGIEVNVLS